MAVTKAVGCPHPFFISAFYFIFSIQQNRLYIPGNILSNLIGQQVRQLPAMKKLIQ
jgi:hypothetical protein